MRAKQVTIILVFTALSAGGGYYAGISSGSIKYSDAIRNLQDAEDRVRRLSSGYSELERTNSELARERDALRGSNTELTNKIKRADAANRTAIANASRAVESIGQIQDREQRIARLFDILEKLLTESSQ